MRCGVSLCLLKNPSRSTPYGPNRFHPRPSGESKLHTGLAAPSKIVGGYTSRNQNVQHRWRRLTGLGGKKKSKPLRTVGNRDHTKEPHCGLARKYGSGIGFYTAESQPWFQEMKLRNELLSCFLTIGGI